MSMIFVKLFLRTKLSYYLVYVDLMLPSLPFVHVLLPSSSENIECFNTFKDIVQPKKRGVQRGINGFVSTSYTIADIFFEHLKG
jgi:hypothetical protein